MSEARFWRIWPEIEEIGVGSDGAKWIYSDLGCVDQKIKDGADDAAVNNRLDFFHEEIKRMVPFLDAVYIIPRPDSSNIAGRFMSNSNSISLAYHKNPLEAVEYFYHEVFHAAHRSLRPDEQIQILDEAFYSLINFSRGQEDKFGNYLDKYEERGARSFASFCMILMNGITLNYSLEENQTIKFFHDIYSGKFFEERYVFKFKRRYA